MSPLDSSERSPRQSRRPRVYQRKGLTPFANLNTSSHSGHAQRQTWGPPVTRLRTIQVCPVCFLSYSPRFFQTRLHTGNKSVNRTRWQDADATKSCLVQTVEDPVAPLYHLGLYDLSSLDQHPSFRPVFWVSGGHFPLKLSSKKLVLIFPVWTLVEPIRIYQLSFD